MKQKFIHTLILGEAISEIFVLSQKTVGKTKSGKSFLSLVLADKTGSIDAKVWDDVESITLKAVEGDFVKVVGQVTEYQGKLQITVNGLAKMTSENMDAADYIATTTKDIQKLQQELTAFIQSVKNASLKDLLLAFWENPVFKKSFSEMPAAKKIHHVYLGGLLEHTVMVTKLMDHYCTLYSDVNRDLGITGAVLHDIGKLKEFSFASSIDYTVTGRLLSHVYLGVEMINEKLVTFSNFDDQTAMLLRHMVLSHHGEREFGALILPHTIEAILLHYADTLDAKMAAVQEHIGKHADGLFTEYHRPMERYFYIGDKKEK